MSIPRILDVCCSGKGFWFNKNDPRVTYLDRRCETIQRDLGTPGTKGRKPVIIKPDMLSDFASLPFRENSFDLIVFDPPHIKHIPSVSILQGMYGSLKDDWRDKIRLGFSECYRVLKQSGTLIFKWSETSYPVSEVLKLANKTPLFGHRSGKLSKTHWLTFIKDDPFQW